MRIVKRIGVQGAILGLFVRLGVDPVLCAIADEQNQFRNQ